jgi:hypothetical protein
MKKILICTLVAISAVSIGYTFSEVPVGHASTEEKPTASWSISAPTAGAPFQGRITYIENNGDRCYSVISFDGGSAIVCKFK